MPVYAVKPKRTYTRGQGALAAAMLLFGYLYMRAFFFGDASLGRTAFVLLLLAVSVLYMVHERLRPNAAAITAGVLTGAFSLMFTVGLSGIPSFLNSVFCQLSYTYFVYKTFDTSIERGPGALFGFDVIRAVFAQPFSSFGSLFPALFSQGKTGNRRALKTIGFVLLGLMLSIVPTVMVVSLLSFDAHFTALLDRFFSPELNVFTVLSHIVSFLLGIPVALYVFGLWASGSFGVNAGMNRESCAAFRERVHVLPPLPALAAVTPVLLVYVLFFASQFAFYTSALTGVLPEGYSYAEYARGGFFELCAVMVVNGVLAFGIGALVRNSGRNVVVRVYTALLSLSTLVLAATAVSKMLLYVDAYGLTLSRVYTLWFMLVIALVFAVLLVRTLVVRTPFVPIALSVSLVLFGALIFSNTPAAVSTYNTEQVLAGKAWVLDEAYFHQLGEAAIPDAVRLEQSNTANAQTRAGAKAFLDYYDEYGLGGNDGVFAFSVTRARAQQALDDRKAAK